jgi:hypothetical protein
MQRTKEEAKKGPGAQKAKKEGAEIQEKSGRAAAMPPPPPEITPDPAKARRTSGKILKKSKEPNKGPRAQIEEVKVMPQHMNPPKQKEVPRTLLQTKSPKPALATPTTTNKSPCRDGAPRIVRIFDQPASQRDVNPKRSPAINRRDSGKPQVARIQEKSRTKRQTPPKMDELYKKPGGKGSPK